MKGDIGISFVFISFLFQLATKTILRYFSFLIVRRRQKQRIDVVGSLKCVFVCVVPYLFTQLICSSYKDENP